MEKDWIQLIGLDGASIPDGLIYVLLYWVQIIVGVLQKYVNLAAGWRPRLFVLHEGVLKYYQVYGPNRVAVVDLLDRLRGQGDVVLVGVQIGVLEKEQQRMNGHVVAGEGL